MTIEEKKKWILENCLDENGNIDLSGLDFSDFDGDVYMSHMKVEGNLFQGYQEVEGNLFQGYQEVEGNLRQDNQQVEGNLRQDNQQVEGNLRQGYQEVKGNLFQGYQEVKGILCEQKTMILNNHEYKIDDTDGYRLGIVDEFQKLGFTFKKLINYYGDYVYLVSNGRMNYHSRDSFKEAVKFLKEKIKVFNENVKPKLEAIKQQGYITRDNYRELTGACVVGTNAFCERVGISRDVESITIEELKDKLLPSDYGYDVAKLLWSEEE